MVHPDTITHNKYEDVYRDLPNWEDVMNRTRQYQSQYQQRQSYQSDPLWENYEPSLTGYAVLAVCAMIYILCILMLFSVLKSIFNWLKDSDESSNGSAKTPRRQQSKQHTTNITGLLRTAIKKLVGAFWDSVQLMREWAFLAPVIGVLYFIFYFELHYTLGEIILDGLLYVALKIGLEYMMEESETDESETSTQQNNESKEHHANRRRGANKESSANERHNANGKNSANNKKPRMRTTKRAKACQLLGVDQDASKADIRRVYRKLSLTTHPDKVPEDERPAAGPRFVKIKDAYELLDRENEELRRRLKAYDQPFQEAYGMSFEESFEEEFGKTFEEVYGHTYNGLFT